MIFLYAFSNSIRTSRNDQISLEVQLNKEPITSLLQEKKIKRRIKEKVDIINFPKSDSFTHYKYGKIGRKNNIFAEFKGRIEIKNDVKLHIKIHSDDGFSIKIGEKYLITKVKNRKFDTPESIEINLKKGISPYMINYFQGSGNAGLHIEYKVNDSDFYDWGENSKNISFKLLNNI